MVEPVVEKIDTETKDKIKLELNKNNMYQGKVAINSLFNHEKKTVDAKKPGIKVESQKGQNALL